MALWLLPFGAALGADALTGRVVSIADGDTFTLLTPAKEQVKVRLAEIDTPERRQPYGTRARQALADLVFGREVRVVPVERDRYGRLVGRVYLPRVEEEVPCQARTCPDPRDVNARLVHQGAAWVYRRYSEDPKLLALEKHARETGAGLWGLPEAQRTPPWEWRRGQRGTASAAARAPFTGEVRCGTKRYCRQMSSCAEARAYRTRCGVDTLDGDGDGVPCEALCR